MPESSTDRRTKNFKSNSDDIATRRRPIKNKTQHLDENQKENFRDGYNNSPSETTPYQNLYPNHEIDSDEQYEENSLNHVDGVNDRSEYLSTSIEQISADGSSAFPNLRYIFGLLLLIIFGFLCFSSFSCTHKPVKFSLNEVLLKIEDRFQNQNRFTFSSLGKALKKVVNVTETPSAPAIFTVTVNENAIHKSHEFLHYLANALAPQKTVIINESVSRHSEPDNIKYKIDQEIQSKAEENELFVVIVDNLQNIPLKGAMIFHSYCDHELAPFKQAVFFFIVPLNKILPPNTPSKIIDSSAFKQFKNIWNKATPDEIDSLITRITVNVINIS